MTACHVWLGVNVIEFRLNLASVHGLRLVPVPSEVMAALAAGTALLDQFPPVFQLVVELPTHVWAWAVVTAAKNPLKRRKERRVRMGFIGSWSWVVQ